MICVTVARKPLIGSVAANVLRHGIGGIAIDTCRIQHNEDFGDQPYRPWATSGANYREIGNDHRSTLNEEAQAKLQNLGRWPANLVLCHLAGCVRDGVKQVTGNKLTFKQEGQGGSKDRGRSIAFRYGALPVGQEFGYANQDGMETVPSWSCQMGCPVAELDKVTTVSSKRQVEHSRKRTSGEVYPQDRDNYREDNTYGDSGGVSRFFKQLQRAKE